MFTTRPEIIGSFGVVASTHWLASAAGMAMLERGGNAFDAAVSMGFALQVVEPHLNGPGGEVPILLAHAEDERIEAICGQGVAPAAATIDAYRQLGIELIPGDGLLAACVPGAFDAWMLMLRDYGSLTLAEVFAHALAYAGGGYAILPRICETIASVQPLFEDEWVSSAEIYLPGGGLPEPYSLFRNPVLARTYGRLVAEAEAAGGGDRIRQIEAARRIWAQGFVAEAIDGFCRTQEIRDSTGRRNRGLLRGEDLAGWKATIETPATFDYRGYEVAKCGPWSQGPVFLQQLALLEGFDLGAMDPAGPDFIHTVVECAKLAFADRESFYGDPAFTEVPLETLLSATYNDKRRKRVGRRASEAIEPGSIKGFGSPIGLDAVERGEARRTAAIAVGDPTVSGRTQRPGDTCHLDVIDRQGNMVSATPSGGWLHSSPIIPALGFCLGSRAQMFWLEPGKPASLAPGKRPRTTLSPSLARKEGRPYLAFGTPGGDYQDQWSLVFFLRHVHHGMNLQQAIDAPMFQTDHLVGSFWPRGATLKSLGIEDRVDPKTVAALGKGGHEVTLEQPWSLGRISAASRRDGVLKAAANPRGMQGYAIGR